MWHPVAPDCISHLCNFDGAAFWYRIFGLPVATFDDVTVGPEDDQSKILSKHRSHTFVKISVTPTFLKIIRHYNLSGGT